MLKFKFKTGRDKWIFLLTIGLILMILAFPIDSTVRMFTGEKSQGTVKETAGQGQQKDPSPAAPAAVPAQAGSYEQQLEQRVRDILKSVEGVGKVEVMIVLKSSEEKVYRIDTSLNTSLTDEIDSAGGKRKIDNRERDESTILTGSGDGQAPILEKELKPEISGIIISCQGGGSPKVQAEISSAMEALFDLPAHKIKVLKRVE